MNKAVATRHRILKTARKLIIGHGYAGTTLDEIVSATKLTKGAFFYHFKSKSDLANALIEQYRDEDTRFFLDLARQADEHTDNPLENVLHFLKLFEDYLAQRSRPLRSCLYASYIHELEQFEPRVIKAVGSGMKQWRDIYRDKFEALIRHRSPRLPVTADDLAGMVISLIEGGLIQARIDGDRDLLVRQSTQFRQYLQLLFGPIEAGQEKVPRR